MVRQSGRAALIVLAFAILGLIICLMIELAYEQQMIVHLYITEAEMLPALQVLILLIFFMLGIVMAALMS